MTNCVAYINFKVSKSLSNASPSMYAQYKAMGLFYQWEDSKEIVFGQLEYVDF